MISVLLSSCSVADSRYKELAHPVMIFLGSNIKLKYVF